MACFVKSVPCIRSIQTIQSHSMFQTGGCMQFMAEYFEVKSMTLITSQLF